MSGHFEFKLKSIYLNGLRTTNMIGPFKSIDFRFAPAFIFEFNFCLCFRSDLIWNFIMIGSTRTHLHGKLFNWPSVFVLLCFVLVKCCFQESNTPPTKQNCPCNAFTRFYKFQMVLFAMFWMHFQFIFCFCRYTFWFLHLKRFGVKRTNCLDFLLFDRTSFFIKDQFDGNIV